MEELSENEKKIFLKNDAKAKSIIIRCISDKHIEYIKDAKTAYEMLENLEKVLQRKTVLTKLYCRRSLLQLKCDQTKELQEHFSGYVPLKDCDDCNVPNFVPLDATNVVVDVENVIVDVINSRPQSPLRA
uniref:Uncharacterized protein n=1 Tax=Photinus pyralis TaxID=7054 RepID=A0A1Y1N050_PHOPY